MADDGGRYLLPLHRRLQLGLRPVARKKTKKERQKEEQQALRAIARPAEPEEPETEAIKTDLLEVEVFDYDEMIPFDV